MQGLRANEVVAAAFEDIFIVRSEKAFKDDPEKMWSMFIEDDTRKCRDVSKASMFIINFYMCSKTGRQSKTQETRMPPDF